MLLAWTWCATSLLVQLLPALVSWLSVRTLEHLERMHAAQTTEGYQRLKWSAESALARAEGTLEGRSGYFHLRVPPGQFAAHAGFVAKHSHCHMFTAFCSRLGEHPKALKSRMPPRYQLAGNSGCASHVAAFFAEHSQVAAQRLWRHAIYGSFGIKAFGRPRQLLLTGLVNPAYRYELVLRLDVVCVCRIHDCLAVPGRPRARCPPVEPVNPCRG